jgi:predicted nucleotidyltransferase component of viral defense system
MIRMADVQRFAGQSRVDIGIAIQEVVLTILLQRIYTSAVRDRLAFKGGTALRKLVFGRAGRFSEDLDFAILSDDQELAQLELEEVLVGESDDEVTVRLIRSEIAGPGTMQATYRFESPIGAGGFELDVTSNERPVLLGAVQQPLVPQSYFAGLGFTLTNVLVVRSCEMATEKLASIHRRSDNLNPKDIWDLWKWFGVASQPEAESLRMLWPARLWLDAVVWRGPGWFDGLAAKQFNWDRLRPLVPGGRLDPDQIITELKTRVRSWIDDDPEGLLTDAGDRRFRARPQVDQRVGEARRLVTQSSE